MKFNVNDKVYYIDFNGVEYLATIEQTNQPSTFWMNDEYYTISLEYKKMFSKPIIIPLLTYSLEYGRLNLAEYILSKYKNRPIKSEDITDTLKWIRNSDKMSNKLKDKAIDLLSKH